MADPIAGTVREHQRPARTFTGWTQLGRVLGDIIATHARGHHDADPTLDDKERS